MVWKLYQEAVCALNYQKTLESRHCFAIIYSDACQGIRRKERAHEREENDGDGGQGGRKGRKEERGSMA